jgi:hypothetical protein
VWRRGGSPDAESASCGYRQAEEQFDDAVEQGCTPDSWFGPTLVATNPRVLC